MFSHLSVIVFTGRGVYDSVHAGIHTPLMGRYTPWAGNPLGRYPIAPQQVHPLVRYTPWVGTPLARTPPWSVTPPGRYTPLGRYTPGQVYTLQQVHPPGKVYTPWQAHPLPWAGTPLGRYTPMGRYTPPPTTVTAANGTHLTGMLSSCFFFNVSICPSRQAS